MLLFIGPGISYEMGDNNNDDVTTLTQPTWTKHLKIANVFNGYFFSIYETMDGSFYSSGSNVHGSCIQPQGKETIKTATKIPLISRNNIKNIFCNAVNGGGTGFILYRNNTLKAFGNNFSGQMGNGTWYDKPTFKLNEIKLNKKIIIKHIKGAGASLYSILLTLSGELYSTGNKDCGGSGQNVSSNQWKQINGMKNIKTFDVGNTHTICVDNNNNVFAFGANWYGQLGLGNTDNKDQPPIMIPFFNRSKIGIMDVKCGDCHSLALSINHKIYSWGYNTSGQCGFGIQRKLEKITTPEQIPSFKNQTMIKIICGNNHNASINEKGDIFLFGCNEYNECILPNYNPKSDSPKQINDYIKQKYNKVIHKIILGYNNTKLILINNEEKEEIKMNESNINKNQSKAQLQSSKQRNKINNNNKIKLAEKLKEEEQKYELLKQEFEQKESSKLNENKNNNEATNNEINLLN
eukprot:448593_1